MILKRKRRNLLRRPILLWPVPPLLQLLPELHMLYTSTMKTNKKTKRLLKLLKRSMLKMLVTRRKTLRISLKRRRREVRSPLVLLKLQSHVYQLNQASPSMNSKLLLVSGTLPSSSVYPRNQQKRTARMSTLLNLFALRQILSSLISILLQRRLV